MECVGLKSHEVNSTLGIEVFSTHDVIAPAVALLSNLSPEQTSTVLTKKNNLKQIKTEEYLAKLDSTIEKECSLPFFKELSITLENPDLFFHEIIDRIRQLREKLRYERNPIEVYKRLSTFSEILRTLMAGIITIEEEIESFGLEELIPLLEICRINKFPVPTKQLHAIAESEILPKGAYLITLNETLHEIEAMTTSWDKSVEREINFEKVTDRILSFLNKKYYDLNSKEYAQFRSDLEDASKEFEKVLKTLLNFEGENCFLEMTYIKKVCDKFEDLNKFIILKFNDPQDFPIEDPLKNHLSLYFPFLIKGCFLIPVIRVLSENPDLANALALTESKKLNQLLEKWKDIEDLNQIEDQQSAFRYAMHQEKLQNQQLPPTKIDKILLQKKKKRLNQGKLEEFMPKDNPFIQNFIESRPEKFSTLKETHSRSAAILIYSKVLEENLREIKIVEVLQLLALKRGLKTPLAYPTDIDLTWEPPRAYLSSPISPNANFNSLHKRTVCKALTFAVLSIAMIMIAVALSRFKHKT